jgi:hypothetical protein
LDADGTGTNNGIYSTVGTSLPAGSKVEAWNGSSFKISTFNGTAWSLNNSVISNAMNPGSGFFLFVPTPTNVTFVGNVITGTNTYPIAAGYQISAPSGPVSETIDGAGGYKPSVNDQIEVWTGGSFKVHTYNGTAWNGGGDPTLSVGQAVFLHAVNNTNWTEVLNVQ